MIRIGMVKALYYYDYGRQWEKFFQLLGAEVVVSGDTTAAVIEKGGLIDEVCLPVKVFFGHAAELADKVDVLFVPRFISVKRNEYCCPKYLGLPDLIKNTISPRADLFSVDIDMRKDRSSLLKAVLKCGSMWGKSPITALAAWYKAVGDSKQALPSENLDIQRTATVGVIGHSYLLNDPVLCMNITKHLAKQGIRTLMPGAVTPGDITRSARLVTKRIYWTQAHYMCQNAYDLMLRRAVNGLIFFSVFGCGPDSLIGEMIKYYAKQLSVPFMLLTVDEHTAETGFVTRIEAFADMLRRRIEYDCYFPTDGNNGYSC